VSAVTKALEYARALPRYRTQTLSQRHSGGFFVAQVRIKLGTRNQCRKAGYAMGLAVVRIETLCHKTMWLRIEDIRSEQLSLRRDKLVWHINHYARMQRGPHKKYPAVVVIDGALVLWDGNHRVTAASLLGKKSIRCDCYFPPEK
jgi:hypothetical protein